MIKLNLTYVQRTERTSAKTNKPFTSLSIKATQYGDRFLSGFGNKENANWKEGMEVEVAEVKEVTKDGKTYFNFETPKTFGGGVNPKQLEEILNNTASIKFMVTAIFDHFIKNAPKDDKVTGTDIPYPSPASQGLRDDGKTAFDDELGFNSIGEGHM